MSGVRDQLVRAMNYSDVSYQRGRLTIVTHDPEKQESASSWLADNYAECESEILGLLSIPTYYFRFHKTGGYGESKNWSGVTLQFADTVSEQGAYCTFNAHLKYQRGPNRGKRRPEGEFTPRLDTRRSKTKRQGRTQVTAFEKFWQRAGLPAPRTKSVYHEKMWMLSDLVFTAVKENPSKPENLSKESVTPLSLGSDEVRELLNPSIINQQSINNSSIIRQQSTSIKNPPKASNGEASSCIQVRANIGTVKGHTVTRLIGSEGSQLDSEKDPFLVEYENAPGLGVNG